MEARYESTLKVRKFQRLKFVCAGKKYVRKRVEIRKSHLKLISFSSPMGITQFDAIASFFCTKPFREPISFFAICRTAPRRGKALNNLAISFSYLYESFVVVVV